MKNKRLTKIGPALRKLRKDKKMTQKELASRCSIPRSYISSLENDMKLPKLRTIFVLASGLGMKASELMKEIESFYLDQA